MTLKDIPAKASSGSSIRTLTKVKEKILYTTAAKRPTIHAAEYSKTSHPAEIAT